MSNEELIKLKLTDNDCIIIEELLGGNSSLR